MIEYRKKRWVLLLERRDACLKDAQDPDSLDDQRTRDVRLLFNENNLWALYHEWRADWLATYNAVLCGMACSVTLAEARGYAKTQADETHGALPEPPE